MAIFTKIFTRKKMFVTLPIALISIELYLGVLFGYFIGKYLSGRKMGERPRFWKSIVFRIGDYKIHLHHWLYSLGILVSFASFSFFPVSGQLSLGFLTGVIFHGVVSYPDWYKVVIRRRKQNT